MSTRILLRRDTAAAWSSLNPVLAAGEPAVERDTGKLKIGDGTSAWSSLPYILDVSDLTPVIQDLLADLVPASYTDEQVRDVIGGTIAGDGDFIAVTASDAGNTIRVEPGAALSDAVTTVQGLVGDDGLVVDEKLPARLSDVELRAAHGLVVVPTVTASATLAPGKYTPVNSSGGPVLMTLPTGAPEGAIIGVEKIDGQANTVSAVKITGNIRGVAGASITLAVPHQSATFRADSAGSWWPVAGRTERQPYTTGFMGSSPWSIPLLVPGVIAGIDTFANHALLITESGIFNDDAAVTNLGTPSGSLIDLQAQGRSPVYQWVSKDGRYYTVLPQASSPYQWSIYRAPGAGPAPRTWDKVFDLTTGPVGQTATAFPQCLDGNTTTVFCAEYGDPRQVGTPQPTVWKSTDGVTWTAAFTEAGLRHIHAVACDPYNEGHVYITTGDGASQGRLMHSADNGATWTTLFASAQWQSVQISFSETHIWLAPDSDWISVIAVDRAAPTTPIIAARNFHGWLPVPGGEPGDTFFSKSFWGAWDDVTEHYFFIAMESNTYGTRYGIFYLDQLHGSINLLAPLPDTYRPGRVLFLTDESNRRVCYAGSAKVNITGLV